MKVVVFGAGAIGSLLGARLAVVGHDVCLIGRAPLVRVVRAHGLRVAGVRPGRVEVRAATALSAPTDAEAILLSVKTFDLDGAIASIGAAVPLPQPTLLPQNGLGVLEHVTPRFERAGWAAAPAVLVRAVNSIPAHWQAIGVVQQPGEGEIVLSETERAGAAGPSTQRWAELLASGGIPVRRVPDLARELWRKALVNAAINPVSALARVPNGRLRDAPFRARAWALLREAQRAAAAAGVPIPDAEADRALERILQATAANRSSMLQDVERGRPTEIDAISGEILRIAEARGIDLPATRAVVAELAAARRPGAGRQPS
ncbi:MAG TPA: ketopantoate reductase family protein [Thermoplasmata archaeon]|nr:ketopantoate reductase family protein [Thermoplasmata archaeon]